MMWTNGQKGLRWKLGLSHWCKSEIHSLMNLRAALCRGRAEGAESDWCSARLLVARIAGGCIVADSETMATDGVQQVEHAVIAQGAIYVAHSEAPGMQIFRRIYFWTGEAPWRRIPCGPPNITRSHGYLGRSDQPLIDPGLWDVFKRPYETSLAGLRLGDHSLSAGDPSDLLERMHVRVESRPPRHRKGEPGDLARVAAVHGRAFPGRDVTG